MQLVVAGHSSPKPHSFLTCTPSFLIWAKMLTSESQATSERAAECSTVLKVMQLGCTPSCFITDSRRKAVSCWGRGEEGKGEGRREEGEVEQAGVKRQTAGVLQHHTAKGMVTPWKITALKHTRV